jgi:hypothetical protein
MSKHTVFSLFGPDKFNPKQALKTSLNIRHFFPCAHARLCLNTASRHSASRSSIG